MKYTARAKIQVTMDQLQCRQSNRLDQVRNFGFHSIWRVSRNSMKKNKDETIRIVLLFDSGAGLRATNCHGLPNFE